jgi:putative acetyltransferase
MIEIIRTDTNHLDFNLLVQKLDQDLAITDGDDHAFYDQFNKLININQVIVAYENKLPVGCGAIKVFDSETMEVKRMYALPQFRGKGIATIILLELEKWAKHLGYKRCVLETGSRQLAAIALYKKNGYARIDNYGQYTGVENSFCFEKKLD